MVANNIAGDNFINLCHVGKNASEKDSDNSVE
jgi:hypothetical protein